MLELFDNENLEGIVFLEMSNNENFGDTSIITTEIRRNEPTGETDQERKPSKVGKEKKQYQEQVFF